MKLQSTCIQIQEKKITEKTCKIQTSLFLIFNSRMILVISPCIQYHDIVHIGKAALLQCCFMSAVNI